MNQSRLWTIGATLVVFALIAGTWFVAIAPRLNDARNADESLVQAAMLNDAHRQALLLLQDEFERMAEIRAELDSLQSVIPETPQVSEFIAAVDTLARLMGTTVVDMVLGEAVLYVPPVIADSEMSATANQLAQSGLYVAPVSVTIEGTQSSVLNFVAGLQQNQRYILVHGVDLNPTNSGSSVSLTIQGQLFGLSDAVIPPVDTPVETPPTPAP